MFESAGLVADARSTSRLERDARTSSAANAAAARRTAVERPEPGDLRTAAAADREAEADARTRAELTLDSDPLERARRPATSTPRSAFRLLTSRLCLLVPPACAAKAFLCRYASSATAVYVRTTSTFDAAPRRSIAPSTVVATATEAVSRAIAYAPRLAATPSVPPVTLTDAF
jgi:hypothetical protein